MNSSLLLLVDDGGWSLPSGYWQGPTSASRVLQLFYWQDAQGAGADLGISISQVFSGANHTEVWNLTKRKRIYSDNAETRIGAASEVGTGMLCFGCEWGNSRALFLGPNGEVQYGASMKRWGISAVTWRDSCYVSSIRHAAGPLNQSTEKPTFTNARTGHTTTPFDAKALVNNMVVHEDKVYATGIFGEYKTMCNDGRIWNGDALMLCSWRGRLWCTTGAEQVSIPGDSLMNCRVMVLDEARGWQHVASLPAKQGSSIVADEANDRLLVATFPQQAVWAVTADGKVTKVHEGPQNPALPTRGGGASIAPMNPDRSSGAWTAPGIIAYTGSDRAYVYTF